MSKYLLIFLLIAISGCQKKESAFEIEQQKYVDELNWLLDANPDEDFEEAISRKDFRFKGIYGFSITVPRINLKCLNFETDIDPIKGTTDAVMGYEHAKLIAMARVYADHFNLRMYLYLSESRGFKCNS